MSTMCTSGNVLWPWVLQEVQIREAAGRRWAITNKYLSAAVVMTSWMVSTLIPKLPFQRRFSYFPFL